MLFFLHPVMAIVKVEFWRSLGMMGNNWIQDDPWIGSRAPSANIISIFLFAKRFKQIFVAHKNLVLVQLVVLFDPLHHQVDHVVLHRLLLFAPSPPPPPGLLQRDCSEQHSSSHCNRRCCCKQCSVLVHLENINFSSWLVLSASVSPLPGRLMGGHSWRLDHLQNHHHHSKG